MGKAVEEADDDQNQGVRDHDGLIPHPIDDFPHQGGRKEPADRGNGKQGADGHRVGSVEQDQHIGSEGKEHLFPGAVENLQHVIFGIFLVEVESALVGVGLTFAGYFKGED